MAVSLGLRPCVPYLDTNQVPPANLSFLHCYVEYIPNVKEEQSKMSFLPVSLGKCAIPHQPHARNKVNTRDWNHDVQSYLTIKTSFIRSYSTNSYWENKDGNMRPAGKKKERERGKEDIIRDCRDSILIYLDRKVQRVCSLLRSTLTLTWLSGLFWVQVAHLISLSGS